MLEILKKNFSKHVKDLQEQITQELLQRDPSITLTQDLWQREDFHQNPGGGGITNVFTGELFENAGVNTSEIYGSVDPKFYQTLGEQKANSHSEVWAAGISLIIHPRNPRIPTVHANFRMLHLSGTDTYWFGGGADLTPYYPYPEDFSAFHHVWAKTLAPYGLYPRMKKECDEYFVNHHRGLEMRGIGGIFFDHYRSANVVEDFNQVCHISRSFIPSYFPLVDKRRNEMWTPEDEDFQLHRRGRYVEFNLLHDRGTLFGLKSNGRTDSIFVSLPARCKFSYRYAPPEQSPHEQMMQYYYPKDWINEAGNFSRP